MVDSLGLELVNFVVRMSDEPGEWTAGLSVGEFRYSNQPGDFESFVDLLRPKDMALKVDRIDQLSMIRLQSWNDYCAAMLLALG